MPILQVSYSQNAFRALPGALAEAFSPRRIENKFARGLLAAGRMGFKVTPAGTAAEQSAAGYPGEVFQMNSTAAAADVDAIGSAVSSAAGPKTIGSGITAGVIGAGPFNVPRHITVTFDSSTDWDPTTGTITYVDSLGNTIIEALPIATSTTFTSTAPARSFVGLSIPTQTGAGGTATVGLSALVPGALTIDLCYGVVVRQPMKTMPSNATNLYQPVSTPASSPNANYIDGDTVPVLTIGDIWVECEEAVADRDPVFVRIAAGAGGSVIGAFRNDADTATCIQVPGARFKRASSGAGVAWASFAAF